MRRLTATIRAISTVQNTIPSSYYCYYSDFIIQIEFPLSLYFSKGSILLHDILNNKIDKIIINFFICFDFKLLVHCTIQ